MEDQRVEPQPGQRIRASGLYHWHHRFLPYKGISPAFLDWAHSQLNASGGPATGSAIRDGDPHN
ncbi:hypothetical protein H1R20_g13781, partial [Candolleomyces eurysporus]